MYRNLELAKALSQIDLLQEVDDLKRQVDAMRPLPKEVEDRLLQKLRLDWNYHSNAIEGNPYTYGETVAFLMEGITAKGKTLKDHLDIKGHDDAIQYLLSIVKDKNYKLTEAEIRNLHKMLLKEPYFSDAVTADGLATRKEIKLGSYKSTPNHVKTPTGAIHYYASPEETPIKMGELVEWFNVAIDNSEIHPIVVASLFHHQFTAIHPFDDGNGRMARLLMNLILLQLGYPPIVIKQQDRNNYYQVLRRADIGEYFPIVEYIATLLLYSLKVYLKGAQGAFIEEADDIDKEITLFKKGLSDDKIKFRRDLGTISEVILGSVSVLVFKLKEKITLLKDLFLDSNFRIVYLPEGSNSYQEFSMNSLPVKDYVREVGIDFSFENFKQIEGSSLFHYVIIFEFHDFHYKVFMHNVAQINYRKKYGDNLSLEEIKDITTYSLRKVLSDLNNASKDNEQEET